MLVLQRKEGESIVMELGETRIEVTVARANHGISKIHIEAPDEVTILRKELTDEIE